MKIFHVVGARPNFMKVAPVHRALRKCTDIQQAVVHTGQHYDYNMSDVFFQQLGLEAPDFNLQCGSASHARQTAEIMLRFEPLVVEHSPDLVLVYGDVNSTVATALVCSKLRVPLGHVEAGLRSFDRSMPEEINRMVTDVLADLLFTPSEDGNRNLEQEGVPTDKIHLVGNVMIDTLVRMLPESERVKLPELPSTFILVTLHRAANVDDPAFLSEMLRGLRTAAKKLPVVFPVHPRTRAQLAKLDMGIEGKDGLILLDPLPYLEFLALQRRAAAVITDSGGIQEETTYLGIPCLTVRDNTERPITIEVGTNTLVGRDVATMLKAVDTVLSQRAPRSSVPPLWDGQAAERIAEVIVEWGRRAGGKSLNSLSSAASV